MRRAVRSVASYLGRVVACAVAYFAGVIAGAAVTSAMGAALPAVPPPADPGRVALFTVLASVVLGAGMAPLASGLAVGVQARWAILAGFLYVCLGLNTAIESAIFTALGGTGGMLIFNVFAALGLGAALAVLFRARQGLEPWGQAWRRFRGQFTAAQWATRVAAAWLAFPVIYLLFGSLIAPFVVESYRAGQHGLVLPPMTRIVPVQLLRSALFLAASVPVLVAWRGTRVGLVLALGAAHFVVDGLSGMLQAYWLPAGMRVAHSAEILADSLAYAAALVVLLAAGKDARVGCDLAA